MAHPLPGMEDSKYWPPVGRLDNIYGDRNRFFNDEEEEIQDAPPIPSFKEDPKYCDPAVKRIEDAWPPVDGWSGMLRFGSVAANQRLWLISRYIRGFVEPGAPLGQYHTDRASVCKQI